ncbi:MAG TPA: PAS domain S-box protein, partial [Leptospiraceae bacterium]|nr:PAS domain S-box protein [Leptospiraceae bacterium]
MMNNEENYHSKIVKIQNLLEKMEGEGSIFEICSEIQTLPGIKSVFFESGMADPVSVGSIQRMAVRTEKSDFGCIVIQIEDNEKFFSTAPYISLFCSFIAVKLENLNLERNRLRIEKNVIETERIVSDILLENVAKYELLVETSPEAIIIHQDGKFIFINSAGLRLFGADSADAVIGKNVIDFVHPDYRKTVLERIKKSISEKTSVPFIEEKFINLNGDIITAEAAAASFMLNGRPAMQVCLRDITERKKTEE